MCGTEKDIRCRLTKRSKQMSYQVYNFTNNDDVEIIAQLGQFQVIQWDRDLSVMPWSAITAYFSAKMNVRRRQLIANLDGQRGVTLQAGAMQWTVGNVEATTGVNGVGDFIGKAFRGAVSQDSIIKPEYRGSGKLVCEPTYRHILLIDTAKWNGSVVLNDGLFLACDGDLQHDLQRRSNFSSAVAGNEGLFNLRIDGNGVVALECPCPEQEIVYVDLRNDVLKVDGNYALAWTSGLEFTVERSGKSLIGSAVSGEGLVNVYRGTGRVMMAPMQAATDYAVNAAIPTS